MNTGRQFGQYIGFVIVSKPVYAMRYGEYNRVTKWLAGRLYVAVWRFRWEQCARRQHVHIAISLTL